MSLIPISLSSSATVSHRTSAAVNCNEMMKMTHCTHVTCHALAVS